MELFKLAKIPAIVATSHMTVDEAVELMVKNRVGAVVVIDRCMRAVGIFTERDNLTRVTFRHKDPRTTLLLEAMTAPIDTAEPDMSVEDALAQMIRRRYRHLPIVDTTGCVLGIVSLRHLMMRMLSRKEANLQALSAYVSAGGPG
jgi:CBS domain-containing protein